ncbi:MAG TPA: RdgB/HAM1 family non-canonical purine NTP pyrophosphatase [Armatimonadota bacterium]|jgi:XTP/dITP diphosphohydrolase
MATRNTLILATANAHKVREMESLLVDCGWAVAAAPAEMAEIEETGSTFAENARIKALATARATKNIALADDSGLMVDGLNGEPGVHSKRWAGDDADDGDRIAKLLNALDSVPYQDRTARFVCAACIAGPEGVLWEGEGRVEGVIALAPSGNGGFGYDPIFHVPEAGRTMANLSEKEKNAISHRGRAMSQAAEWLRSNKAR